MPIASVLVRFGYTTDVRMTNDTGKLESVDTFGVRCAEDTLAL